MEIIETGDLRRISYEKTDDVEAINLFQGIYGVGMESTALHLLIFWSVGTGRQIARMWYNNGCRTLDDVRARKGGIKLSQVQEVGLKFYDGRLFVFTCIGTWLISLLPDINDRMPRSEAESIFNLIKPIGKVLRYGFSRLIDVDMTQTALELDEHLYIDIMGSFRRFVVVYFCLPYPHVLQ